MNDLKNSLNNIGGYVLKAILFLIAIGIVILWVGSCVGNLFTPEDLSPTIWSK